MASFFDLISQLQSSINDLDAILTGSNTQTVNVNGTNKDSISKAINDQFIALQSMVQGRLTYETKGEMAAAGSPPSGELAEVWNDATKDNNGLYGWSGSAWSLSKYDPSSLLKSLVIAGDLSIKEFVNEQAISNPVKNLPLTENNFSMVWGVAVGNKVLGYFDSAGIWHSEHSHETLPVVMPETENDVLWGVSSGNKLLGYFDGDGVWHSDHTHSELTGLQSATEQNTSDIQRINNALETTSGNQGGWLANEVAVAEEQHVFIHDNLQYRQITPAGANWYAPVVHHYDVVRCLSDYSTNSLEPHTLLSNGEITPEDGVLQQQLVTGQSLSLGSRGYVLNEDGQYEFQGPNGIGDLFTITCPSDLAAHCLTLNNGVRKAGSELIATAELPDGVLGETICSSYMIALATHVKNESGGTIPRLVSSISGVGGVDYAALKKGTSTYNSALARTQEIAAAALVKGWKHIVNQVRIIHGESQGVTTEAEYSGFIREWVTDYQFDLVAITGQRHNPVGVLCQMNTQGNSNFEVPLAQLKAHNDHADIILIGPKYQHPYWDAAHMLAEGYVKTGELEARAMRFWQAKKKWQPLKPSNITAVANQVTIDFNNTIDGINTTAGPVGVLALDTTHISNPGDYGFTCSDNTVAITDISLGADNTSVVITFDNPPADGSSISYALQADLSQPNGGSRGNLRDNDTRDDSRFDDEPLYNWCVAFRLDF
jgi:hypothetical protein